MNEEFQFEPTPQVVEAPEEYLGNEPSSVESEPEPIVEPQPKPKRSRAKSKKKEVAPEPKLEPISEKTERPVRIYTAEKLRARLRR
jgi:hypothetical protein